VAGVVSESFITVAQYTADLLSFLKNTKWRLPLSWIVIW